MENCVEKIYCCDRGDNNNIKVIEEKMEEEMRLKRVEVCDVTE